MENSVQGWREIPLPPSGVYALMQAGKVVYIGQSTNVLVRISTHRNRLRRWREGWVPKRGEGIVFQFDHAFVQWTPIENLDALEYEMINKYRPKFNTALLEGNPMAMLRKIKAEASREYHTRKWDRDGPGLDFDLKDLGIEVWQTPSKPPQSYLRR